MSHLQHIVLLKQDLISNDVNGPVQQAAIARTAYVKALIHINAVNKLDEEQRNAFNRFVLGYWNEVTPVNGQLVVSAINRFFYNLESFLAKSFTANTLEVPVVEAVEDVKFKWEELDTYRNLVQTLVTEGNHKLAQFMPTDNIV